LIDCWLDISLDGYAALARCLNHYVNRMRPNTRNNGSCTTVTMDFLPLKKPGKKIRTSLVKKSRKAFKPRWATVLLDIFKCYHHFLPGWGHIQ
jgi:hypothetical protein